MLETVEVDRPRAYKTYTQMGRQASSHQKLSLIILHIIVN